MKALYHKLCRLMRSARKQRREPEFLGYEAYSADTLKKGASSPASAGSISAKKAA